MPSPSSTIVDLAQARRHFIKGQLEPQGVHDKSLHHAFTVVPRELFLEPRLQPLAYTDEDLLLLPTPKRFAISPRKLGKLLAALNLKRNEKVLFIGFNTGYSIAIGQELGLKVYGVEEHSLLFSFALDALQTYLDKFYDARNIEDYFLIEEKKHTEGLPEHAPYDAIVVQGGIETVPQSLLSQLRPMGQLVCISENNPKGVVLYDACGHTRSICFEKSALLQGFEKQEIFTL